MAPFLIIHIIRFQLPTHSTTICQQEEVVRVCFVLYFNKTQNSMYDAVNAMRSSFFLVVFLFFSASYER